MADDESVRAFIINQAGIGPGNRVSYFEALLRFLAVLACRNASIVFCRTRGT
ncbi:MAG: hypothetical protein JO108_30035 [Acidobacteriaceae bacterium]|nr:hypothetical protein [Acidobacteriaceae bacterium]